MSRLVLLYHRIGVTESDPWSTSVSPARFEEHMAVLRRELQPGTLADVTDCAGGDAQDAIAVTFDDGYADALHVAAPILERHRVPATFFIVTGMFDTRCGLWWDEMAQVLLGAGELPASLNLVIEGDAFDWTLGEGNGLAPADVLRARDWRAWDDAPTARHALYAALWGRCQRLAKSSLDDVMGQVRAWAGVAPAARDDYRLLSREEVRELARSPIAEIGAHTVDHPVLSALDRAHQQYEIEQSARDLEDLTKRPVTSFAYPFGKAGDYSPQTIELLRAAGITRACSNFPGLVRRNRDVHQVPRLFVEDWSGETFGQKVRALLAGAGA